MTSGLDGQSAKIRKHRTFHITLTATGMETFDVSAHWSAKAVEVTSKAAPTPVVDPHEWNGEIVHRNTHPRATKIKIAFVCTRKSRRARAGSDPGGGTISITLENPPMGPSTNPPVDPMAVEFVDDAD